MNIKLLFAIGACTASIVSAQLPPGAGREETQKLCSSCHELERSVSLRQDRDGWKATINKMMGMGAQGTAEEFAAALDYLAAHYPAAGLPPLNVNTAKAIDFETRLSLKRSEAARVVKYRAEHGPFKSLADLKQVPGVDTAKIEAKQASLVY
ncbi:MAG TPA: helix-hairpin-helix domain-containing protein [Bryobacteraceae bacterium]|nr:helix-hairpin-helix domain-containing protein [Bryobacteraceae bacterium]